jgi:hypothetical protein
MKTQAIPKVLEKLITASVKPKSSASFKVQNNLADREPVFSDIEVASLF